MSGTGRRWVWPALLIWMVGIIGVLGYLLQAKDRGLAVIDAVVAVVALAVPGTVWLWRRARTAAAAPDADGLNRATDALAAAVRAQWEAQAGERLLRYPAPVPVCWRWPTLPVTGSVADAVTTPGGRGFAPLSGLPPATAAELNEGGLADLLGVYGGVDSGRLLVIGAPGAGKSSAAILLVLDALAHRAGLGDEQRWRTPVPVMFTPHGWDPTRQPVGDWLAGRLRAEYPLLKAAQYGPDAATALVRDGRVALLLDGLDELPEAVRPVAVRALDEQVTGMRLVVLTRSREMADTAAVGRHLHRAAAVQLQPVPPEQAAAYLARCRVHPAPAAWQRLVEHVRTCPNSVVTQALDSPLMLSLVRDTLPDEQVDALLSPGRFTSREEVEDELLDRVLPTAYQIRPGQPPPRYAPEQAQRWLGYLAHRMRHDRTRDLAWWQVPTWAPSFPRTVATMLVFGLIFGLALGLRAGLETGLETGLPFGLVVGYAVGLAGSGGSEPQQLGSLRWSSLITGRSLSAGLMAGFTVGFGGVLEAGLAFGLRFGLAVGLMVGLAVGLTSSTSRPSGDAGNPVDPITCWRRTRRHGFVSGLVVGLAFGLTVGLVALLTSGLDAVRVAVLVAAIEVGLVVALAVGPTCSATWPTGLAFLQLRRSGFVPVRLMRFLEDARTRHVLRTAGPIYQFRHARLQDRLADWYTGSTTCATRTAGYFSVAPVRPACTCRWNDT